MEQAGTSVERAPRTDARGFALRRPRAALSAGARATGRLVLGFGTAAAALLLTLAVAGCALLCLVGVGLVLLPPALRTVRALADVERSRLTSTGPQVIGPGPLARPLRAAVTDAALRRELVWMIVHATAGLVLGLAGVQVVAYALQGLTAPLWWRLAPGGEIPLAWATLTVREQADVWVVALVGLGWALALLTLAPGLAVLQETPGRALLGPPPGTDLSLRVAELTVTRAAALDAHAAELRRIERSLHDGTQNRLVAVTVLLGAARRALARDPATADDLLERAQGAAELALAELRAVVRGVLPPVLVDRGLAGALTALAADSPVPCRVQVDVAGRCAAAVEATAYFMVAEALTNAARHSGARRAEVLVRRRGDRLHVGVQDDGGGGASEGAGSGLAGIRRRVDALDGTMTLTSPPGGPTTVDVELPCGS